jgi:hypothetical protein
VILIKLLLFFKNKKYTLKTMFLKPLPGSFVFIRMFKKYYLLLDLKIRNTVRIVQ